MNKSSIPKDWRLFKFGELAESITERVEDPKAAGVEIYVGLEHLDSDTTKISRYGTPEDVASTKLRFYPGDVVYARRRAYQRKLGVAEVEGICSAHALVLRARPEVCLPEFLPYFLQSDQFHDRALSISVGSLSPTINWKTLVVQEFVLPPIAEQQRFVELMKNLDKVICSFQSLPFQILEEAIWGDQLKNGGVEFSTVGQECEIHKGKKPSEVVEGSELGLPYLTADVLRGERPSQFVSSSSLGGCILLEGNETLVLWDGAGAGDVFHGQHGVVASTMVRVRPLQTSRLIPEYLFLALRHLSKEIKSTTRGSTVPHVAPVSFQKLQLVIPSVEDQQKIIFSISEIQSFSVKNEKVLKALGQMRKICLTRIGRVGLLDV